MVDFIDMADQGSNRLTFLVFDDFRNFPLHNETIAKACIHSNCRTARETVRSDFLGQSSEGLLCVQDMIGCMIL